MRATGAECLETGVLSRWLKHSTENLDIGNDNGYTVTLQASRMKEMQSDYLIQDEDQFPKLEMFLKIFANAYNLGLILIT